MPTQLQSTMIDRIKNIIVNEIKADWHILVSFAIKLKIIRAYSESDIEKLLGK